MKERPFDELEYTRDRFIKTALAIENHAKDGSAVEGCTCLQGKHFYELEEYSEEGITISNRENEKEFYRVVAPLARALRKEVYDGTFDLHAVGLNPSHTLTCEQKKARCIADLSHDPNVNAYAVCNAQMKCR
jgi:hypothetical protein